MKVKGSNVEGVVKQDHKAFVDQQLKAEKLDSDWITLLPNEDELFCDLDSKDALDIFVRQFAILNQFEPLQLISLKHSRSGNYHAIVKLQHAAYAELRAMYQAMLGSDIKRELLHLKSIRANELNPILLVVRKGK